MFTTLTQRLQQSLHRTGGDVPSLARACGVSDRTAAAWLQGQACASLAAHLERVADHLDVHPAWLMHGQPPRQRVPAPAATPAVGARPPESLRAVLLACSRPMPHADADAGGGAVTEAEGDRRRPSVRVGAWL